MLDTWQDNGEAIGDDGIKFWRARWLEQHGSTTGKTGARPTTIRDEPQACTCGEAYRQSYNRRCLDCDGEPSQAQRDAR